MRLGATIHREPGSRPRHLRLPGTTCAHNDARRSSQQDPRDTTRARRQRPAPRGDMERGASAHLPWVHALTLDQGIGVEKVSERLGRPRAHPRSSCPGRDRRRRTVLPTAQGLHAVVGTTPITRVCGWMRVAESRQVRNKRPGRRLPLVGLRRDHQIGRCPDHYDRAKPPLTSHAIELGGRHQTRH
jgi:hypothetical protein